MNILTSRLIPLLSFGIITQAFNIDTNSPIIFEDPLFNQRPSYFGYSTSILLAANKTWLLIGAPRGNSSFPRVNTKSEPGVSFLCPVSPLGKCVEYQTTSSRDRGSWVGVATASQHSTGRFAVCGHRFVKLRSRSGESYMSGACFVSNIEKLTESNGGTPENKMLVPMAVPGNVMTERQHQVMTNYALGQFGIAVAFPNNDNHEMIAGAPGILNWCGSTVFMQDPENSDFSTMLDSVTVPSPLTMAYNQYHGYTVTEGHFLPALDVPTYASAAPRAAHCRGQVLVMTTPRPRSQPPIYATITGKQVGALFGAALAAGDMDGDGVDELAIGAPHDMFGGGAIYVYTFSNQNSMTLRYEVRGRHEELLGSALATADLDADGRFELLASAPNVHELRVYAVRADNSASLQLKQTIAMSKLNFQPNILLQGFPSSISVGDVDGNGVPDISVGAYLSGHAVVLRGYPVVRLFVDVLNHAQNILRNATGFNVTICVSYNGTHTPDEFYTWRNITLEDSSRAIYKGQERVRIKIFKGSSHCSDLTIDITRSNSDFLTPIRVEVAYENYVPPETGRFSPTLVTKQGKILGRDFFCAKCGLSPSIVRQAIIVPFATECGADGVCWSQLQIHAKFLNQSNTLVVGQRSVTVEVMVENTLEPAYNCKLQVVSLQKRTRISRIPPQCVCPGSSICPPATCSIGNPLRKTSTKFLIDIDVGDLRIDDHNLTIALEATTASSLMNEAKFILFLKLVVDAKLIITGKSHEDTDTFHVAVGEGNDIETILFQHLYEVQSIGLSPVDNAILTVRLPYSVNYKGQFVAFSGMYQPEGYQEAQTFTCNSSVYQYLTQDASDSEAIAPNYDSNFDLPDSRAKRSISIVGRYKESYFMPPSIHQIVKRSIPAIDRFQIINTSGLPSNRTLRLNCSDPNVVECNEITCKIGPLYPQSVTRLLISTKINISALNGILGQRDIIAVISTGSVEVIESWQSGLAFDMDAVKHCDVASVFAGAPQDARAPAWLYGLSAGLGLLLVLLIVLALIKAGFFRRKMKEEIQAIKAEEKRRSVMICSTRTSVNAEQEAGEVNTGQ